MAMKLKKNIGPKNRTARLIVGIVLIILSLYFRDGWLPLLGVIVGIIMILEAVFSVCVWHSLRGTKDMR